MSSSKSIRFARIYPRIWSEEVIIEIAKLDKSLLALAFYLRTNKSFNMTGLYPLSISQVKRELHYESFSDARKAIKQLCQIHYCKYSFEMEYVFVFDMALMQANNMISPQQKRGIHNILVNLAEENAPFIECFIERYGNQFELDRAEIENNVYDYDKS